MYTLEALIASLIIFGVVVFALSTPSQFGTETVEYTSLQLKKYADDILEILDLENGNHTSLLGEWIEDKNWVEFDNCFRKIGENLRQSNLIMLRVEVYDPDGNLIHSYGLPPPEGAISSFRVVHVSNPPFAYEVRLYLWYV
jgi:hypothetical protein